MFTAEPHRRGLQLSRWAGSSRCGWRRRATTAWSASTSWRRSSCRPPACCTARCSPASTTCSVGAGHPSRHPRDCSTPRRARAGRAPAARRRRRRRRASRFDPRRVRRRARRAASAPDVPRDHRLDHAGHQPGPQDAGRRTASSSRARPPAATTPRRAGARQLDENGEPVYGPRDEVDLAKVAALGLPFWLAGGQATPERLPRRRTPARPASRSAPRSRSARTPGMDPTLRAPRARPGAPRRALTVFTDPLASPTGFPFKVVAARRNALRGRRRTRRASAGATSATSATSTRAPTATGLPLPRRAGRGLPPQGRRHRRHRRAQVHLQRTDRHDRPGPAPAGGRRSRRS